MIAAYILYLVQVILIREMYYTWTVFHIWTIGWRRRSIYVYI